MPRAALTERQIATYRERTVVAATRLFAERGYEAVTMRAIAAELGDSPMTPYRYFRNKDEIFAMVRAEAFRHFADDQEAAFRASDEPLERLFFMREAYFESALANPEQYRVMFQLDQAPAGDYPELERQAERAFACLLAAVEAATSAGLLEGDPLTVAHLLWAHVHGLVALHLAGKLTLGKTIEDLRQNPAVLAGFFRSEMRSRND